MDRTLFRGTRPVVLSTRPERPSEGMTFVWAWTQWYERIEGEQGNVAFSPVAASETELHEWLSQQGEPDPTDVEGAYCEVVRKEFLDQYPLYPEAPELSDEEPSASRTPLRTSSTGRPVDVHPPG